MSDDATHDATHDATAATPEPSGPSLVHRADEDRIAVLTLDSPANRNALSRRLVADLARHLDDVAGDETLHGVLVRSSHRVFCAGADLKEAASTDMTESARGIIALQRRIAALPVPVVIRLDGAVRAGGLGLVASADIVVCASDVTVALTEVRLGLAAATIGIPLRQRLTARAAGDWFLTGRTVTAAQARDGGLVTHVVPPDAVDAAAAGVLDDLRAGTRQGLVAAKALLTADLVAAFDAHGEAMARLSGELFHSALAQEKMAATLRR